jgi:LPS-assembly protein
VIRRHPVLVLACALAVSRLAAAPPALSDFYAENGLDISEHETIAHGPAGLRDGATLFTADEIDYYPASDTIVAIGHVALTLGTERLLASHLVYHRRDGTLNAENVRAGTHPFYVSGVSAEGTKERIVIHTAQVTYNEPGKWRPTIKADQVIYSPHHFLRLGNSRVGVTGLPMVPLWHASTTINASALTNYLTFSGGYRSDLGATGTASLRIPINDEFRVGGDLSIFTARGVMAGPAVTNYGEAGDGSTLFGSFQSGFIYDYGNLSGESDILGDNINRDRAFIAWKHQQQLTDTITLDGEFNWWSDSEVIRDFFPKQFYTVQEPDSYVESVDTGENYFASAFARFQPDSYEPVEERLPELRFDLLPTAIGDGFYERFNSSAVSLLERPPGGGQELSSDRIDMFYGVSHPYAEGDWLTFTPVAGGRLTNYSNTVGAADPGGYTRALGEVGFDSQLLTSGVFNYENPGWDIDGLRHLLTPTLSYRYIPDADQGQPYIPLIDRQTFTPYLQPLELGDKSYVDNLDPENTLRLGLDNTLQTRDDSGYGSRDLVSFDVDEDLYFKRQPGNDDFSAMETDLDLTPTKWLTFTEQDIFSPTTLTAKEVETGVLLNDGDAWSIHLGNDFLRHENDDYIAELRVRLNEMYSLHLVSEYDDRLHLFPQQSVALEENLVNTWAIRYVVTLSAGPNDNTGHFGFNVNLDLIKF